MSGPNADIRPTTRWREERREEAEHFAAGRLSKEECIYERLYPDAFLEQVDLVLDAFDAAIAKTPATAEGHPQVMLAVKDAVIAFNEMSEAHPEWIETGEREALCLYLDEVITRHGVDVDQLAAGLGVGRHEITDEWRDW
jgi:hypothetical protein